MHEANVQSSKSIYSNQKIMDLNHRNFFIGKRKSERMKRKEDEW